MLVLLALDPRPRTALARTGVILSALLAVALSARGLVTLSLVKEESRATKRYVRVLEKNKARHNSALQTIIDERDSLRHQGNVARLALQIGTLAARTGRPMADRQALEIADVVLDASRRHGVPVKLIVGVIMTESGFDRTALSPKGAMGLMQLMPTTAASLSRELGMDVELPGDLRDCRVNIELGTYYLATLLRRHQNIPEALTSYNMGPAHGTSIAHAFIGQVTRHSRSVDL